jgi:hypothetical protein
VREGETWVRKVINTTKGKEKGIEMRGDGENREEAGVRLVDIVRGLRKNQLRCRQSWEVMKARMGGWMNRVETLGEYAS